MSFGLAPEASAQEVGLITNVRLVDTTVGQDIEITSTVKPADFRPERDTDCTFALVVPGLLPGPEVAGQFFSSELVERLTLTPGTGEAATRLCVKATAPVRSRVALRGSGLILRLERVGPAPSIEGGESFFPVDELRQTDPAPGDSASSSAARDSAAESGGAGTVGGASGERDREHELAMREAKVEARELQLEVGQLRVQLANQVSANAALDQEVSRRGGVTDQLVPRIDRLVSMVGFNTSGLERPIERFDAVLAMLEARLSDISSSASEAVESRAAVDEIVALLSGSRGEMVVTNDDVNVRNGPSTDEIRIAFLPRGVLLSVLEQRGPWSRVSAGSFEGWIFGELLSPIGTSGGAGRVGTTAPSGSVADKLLWAGVRIRLLQREMELTSARVAQDADRLRILEAERLASATDTAALADSVASAGLLRDENRAIEDEVASLRSTAANLGEENRALRLQLAAAAAREAADAKLEEDSGNQPQVRAEMVSPEPSDESQQQLDAVRQRLLLLASLAEGDNASVRTTEQTNLRTGPGVNFERLALLPKDFELALLSSADGWYEVSYGRLRGWLSADFGSLAAAPGSSSMTGSLGNDDEMREVGAEGTEELLNRLERALSKPLPSPLTEKSMNGPDGSASSAAAQRAEDRLQAAADALYSQAQAARNGDVEDFIGFYSERFSPREGTRVEWEQRVREQFASGEFEEFEIQNLSLRGISQELLEAKFSPSTDSNSQLKLDLVHEEGVWRVLLETVEVAPSE